jgi:hypothetical protein
MSRASRICGAFAALHICEQAHRDVWNEPLLLRDEDLRTSELRPHLEACVRCRRWYASARRTYERMLTETMLPTLPVPVEATICRAM